MNKKSLIISVVAVIAIVLVLGAIEGMREPEKDDGIFYFHQFEDFSGKKITLDEKPEKVAVLFSSLAEIWTLAGGKVAVTVGESVERGFCSEDVILVDVGAGKTIDNEALIAAEPDLVIYSLDVEAQCRTAELLQREKIPAAGMRIDGVEDYYKALTISSSLLDNEESLELYGDKVLEEIENIKEKAASQKEKPSVLFIRSGSSEASAKAKKAEDNFAAKILQDLGCSNIADSAPVLLDGLSLEEILIRDPEHIFISIMGDEEAGKAYMESLLTSGAWQTLSAVKKGNVHFLEKELFHYKPCSRWAEAYEIIFEILYPGDKIEE